MIQHYEQNKIIVRSLKFRCNICDKIKVLYKVFILTTLTVYISVQVYICKSIYIRTYLCVCVIDNFDIFVRLRVSNHGLSQFRIVCRRWYIPLEVKRKFFT